MNILYIEDNAKDRVLVERYIHTTPHHVTSLPKLDNIRLDPHDVDLILLDIHFGGKVTGLDYLSQIRDMGIQCPVVAVTALTLPHQIASYYDAGIERVVAKPFEITELAEAIMCYES